MSYDFFFFLSAYNLQLKIIEKKRMNRIIIFIFIIIINIKRGRRGCRVIYTLSVQRPQIHKGKMEEKEV